MVIICTTVTTLIDFVLYATHPHNNPMKKEPPTNEANPPSYTIPFARYSDICQIPKNTDGYMYAKKILLLQTLWSKI